MVIDQLKNLSKIYDLLALCSSYILKEVRERSYEFALFNDDDFDCVYEAIERYCNEKNQKGHRKAFEELREYMVFFMEPKASIDKCFAVVKYIDELVEVEIEDNLIGGKYGIKYCSMNEQYRDCVRIIPKMKGTLSNRISQQVESVNGTAYSLFRNQRECACSVLDRETLNYMIWDREHINKYPVWIYRFDEKSPVSKHFYGREQIVFGIVPFTDKPLNEILDIHCEKGVFYIEQMYEQAEKELERRYKNICSRCGYEEIDFLIFPEMLMTEHIISAFKENDNAGSPKIIVNGSIWKDFMNRSVVMDGNGEVLLEYYKKEPYKIKENDVEYKEFLDQDNNREYAIIEIEGFGRIGFGICKDLVNEDFKLFHKCIGTDILLIPAYTRSMDLLSGAEELSKDYHCIVLVANACSARVDSGKLLHGRRIGFITLPAKKGAARSSITVDYKQNECIGECLNQCAGKKIIVNCHKIKEYEDNISCEVEVSAV